MPNLPAQSISFVVIKHAPISVIRKVYCVVRNNCALIESRGHGPLPPSPTIGITASRCLPQLSRATINVELHSSMECDQHQRLAPSFDSNPTYSNIACASSLLNRSWYFIRMVSSLSTDKGGGRLGNPFVQYMQLFRAIRNSGIQVGRQCISLQ